MAEMNLEIDLLLAGALRGEDTRWPQGWRKHDLNEALLGRAIYHGIAGLLVAGQDRLTEWPAKVIASLHQAMLAQVVWEMQHKPVIGDLLTALAAKSVVPIILKGTALAYDVYDTPAMRARGDTDILVERKDLACTRQTLIENGFSLHPACGETSDALTLQEMWFQALNHGGKHTIDLHWQALNSLSLEDTLTFSDCREDSLELPSLCEAARTMSRSTALIYACMHRAEHFTSPYIVDGTYHYGGDRLIWAQDIHLLANALTESEWGQLSRKALEKGVEAVCLDGLRFAQSRLGTQFPVTVQTALAAAGGNSKAANYLMRSGQARRAFADLQAAPGIGAGIRRAVPRRRRPGRRAAGSSRRIRRDRAASSDPPRPDPLRA